MKRTYCSKHDGSSSQQMNQVISLSFIKNVIHKNDLYVHINCVYFLIHVMQRKFLKKLDNIIRILSENDHRIFMEVLQSEELLSGSKGNEDGVCPSLFTKK